MALLRATAFATALCIDMGYAFAQSVDIGLEEIQGTWNHDSTGENIAVTNQMVQDSRLGQGRISSTTEFAANFKITYQKNIQCWYLATLTNAGKRLNLAVRNPQQSEATCLKGSFNLDDSASRPRARAGASVAGGIDPRRFGFGSTMQDISSRFSGGRFGTTRSGTTSYTNDVALALGRGLSEQVLNFTQYNFFPDGNTSSQTSLVRVIDGSECDHTSDDDAVLNWLISKLGSATEGPLVKNSRQYFQMYSNWYVRNTRYLFSAKSYQVEMATTSEYGISDSGNIPNVLKCTIRVIIKQN